MRSARGAFLHSWRFGRGRLGVLLGEWPSQLRGADTLLSRARRACDVYTAVGDLLAEGWRILAPLRGAGPRAGARRWPCVCELRPQPRAALAEGDERWRGSAP
eukprot:3966874-Prymnesium_polylepis.1